MVIVYGIATKYDRKFICNVLERAEEEIAVGQIAYVLFFRKDEWNVSIINVVN